MTLKAKVTAVLLPFFNLFCGGQTAVTSRETSAGDAGETRRKKDVDQDDALHADFRPTLDGLLPACLTALALAMGGCDGSSLADMGASLATDAGLAADTLSTTDSGDDTMVGTTLADGGTADADPSKDMMMPTVPKPEAGAPPAIDVMDVLKRLTVVPRGVPFVFTNLGSATPVGFFITFDYDLPLPTNNKPFDCYQINGAMKGSYDWAARGIVGQGGTKQWEAATSNMLMRTPLTLLTEKELEKFMIAKDAFATGNPSRPETRKAMSLEDWIDLHKDNIDEAISSLKPYSTCVQRK